MKHWNELNSIETQIIRVSEFANLYDLVLNGIENGATNYQIQTGLYTMQGMLEDINDKLYPAFQELWDSVKQESIAVEYDEDGPQYNFKPLEDVINNWTKQ